MEEQAVAVLIPVRDYQTLMNFIGTRPFNEVQQFFKAAENWQGLSEGQINSLRARPGTIEESEEELEEA